MGVVRNHLGAAQDLALSLYTLLLSIMAGNIRIRSIWKQRDKRKPTVRYEDIKHEFIAGEAEVSYLPWGVLSDKPLSETQRSELAVQLRDALKAGAEVSDLPSVAEDWADKAGVYSKYDHWPWTGRATGS